MGVTAHINGRHRGENEPPPGPAGKHQQGTTGDAIRGNRVSWEPSYSPAPEAIQVMSFLQHASQIVFTKNPRAIAVTKMHRPVWFGRYIPDLTLFSDPCHGWPEIAHRARDGRPEEPAAGHRGAGWGPPP